MPVSAADFFLKACGQDADIAKMHRNAVKMAQDHGASPARDFSDPKTNKSDTPRYPELAAKILDLWRNKSDITVHEEEIQAHALDDAPGFGGRISKRIFGLQLPKTFRSYFEPVGAGAMDPDEPRSGQKNTQCGIAALYKAARYGPDEHNAAALWRGSTLCWLCGCPIKVRGSAPQCEHILPALRAIMFKGLISSQKIMKNTFKAMGDEQNARKAWCYNTADNYMWAHAACNGSKGGRVLIKLNIDENGIAKDPNRLFIVDVMKCMDLAEAINVLVATYNYKPQGSTKLGSCYYGYSLKDKGGAATKYGNMGGSAPDGLDIKYGDMITAPAANAKGAAAGSTLEFIVSESDRESLNIYDSQLMATARVYVWEMSRQLKSINAEAAKFYEMIHSDSDTHIELDIKSKWVTIYLHYALECIKLSLNEEALQYTEAAQETLKIQQKLIITTLKKMQNDYIRLQLKFINLKAKTSSSYQKVRAREYGHILSLFTLQNRTQPALRYALCDPGELVTDYDKAAAARSSGGGDGDEPEAEPRCLLIDAEEFAKKITDIANLGTQPGINWQANSTHLIYLLCMLFLSRKFGWHSVVDISNWAAFTAARAKLDTLNEDIILQHNEIEIAVEIELVGEALGRGRRTSARTRANLHAKAARLRARVEGLEKERGRMKLPAYKTKDKWIEGMGGLFHLTISGEPNDERWKQRVIDCMVKILSLKVDSRATDNLVGDSDIAKIIGVKEQQLTKDDMDKLGLITLSDGTITGDLTWMEDAPPMVIDTLSDVLIEDAPENVKGRTTADGGAVEPAPPARAVTRSVARKYAQQIETQLPIFYKAAARAMVQAGKDTLATQLSEKADDKQRIAEVAKKYSQYGRDGLVKLRHILRIKYPDEATNAGFNTAAPARAGGGGGGGDDSGSGNKVLSIMYGGYRRAKIKFHNKIRKRTRRRKRKKKHTRRRKYKKKKRKQTKRKQRRKKRKRNTKRKKRR